MSVLWRAFLPDGGDNELTNMERDLREKLLSSYNSPGGLLHPCNYRFAYALRPVAVKMGIIELLAAFTLMPKQCPTERKETIELGNELLRKVRSAGHLSHIPHGLTFFQEGETRVTTPIDTAECFESSLVLAELEALAHSTPDDMIRVTQGPLPK